MFEIYTSVAFIAKLNSDNGPIKILKIDFELFKKKSLAESTAKLEK